MQTILFKGTLKHEWVADKSHAMTQRDQIILSVGKRAFSSFMQNIDCARVEICILLFLLLDYFGLYL